MWHEARKQERMIRGLIVDYRRRAERRKDFYEKIKAEPTQFLQLHGRPCKIHLDPAVAAAGDSPAIMMPWQGDNNNLIDRFDVRAHLDYIPEVKIPDVPAEDLDQEERQCNYERYRILAQNSFLGISEDKFLQQLAIEEQFGVTIEEKEAQKEKLQEKKGTGVAIGYNYNDPGAQPSSTIGPETKATKVEQKDSDDDSDLEIIDVDLSIDVNKMEAPQAHELNAVGPLYGMAGCDLFSFLTGDADDAEHQKQLLREEKEKAMFSGRKSRRERRAHRDKKLASRVISPPSYAAPSSDAARQLQPSRSPSRSPSPADETHDHIQFITSFGGDDDDKPPPLPKQLYSEKLKHNLKRTPLYSDVARKPKARSRSLSAERSSHRPVMGPHRPRSVSRSLSRSPSRSRSRSRSLPRRRSRSSSASRSSSRSRSPSYRRSRSRSRSHNYRRRSTSVENQSSSKQYDSRSMSYEYESVDKGAASKPAVPRYYGRKKEQDKSSSELSADSESSDGGEDDKTNKSAVGDKSNTNQSQLRLTGSSAKGSRLASREGVSLKEKLKRKMQAQLSRQLRADKRAEAERLERESRRQARRDEEMRELAIKLRRKQREMRHQQNRRSSEDSDRSRSGSSDRASTKRDDPREEKSRSKSPSPVEKQIPVWVSGKQDSIPERSTYQEPRDTPNYQENYPRRYHDSTEQRRYHDNTEQRKYHDNTEQRRYNDNTEQRKYHDNTEQRRYDDNTEQRKYHDNTEQRKYHDNTEQRKYHDNTEQRKYHDNTEQRKYHDNTEQRRYNDNPDGYSREERSHNDDSSRNYYQNNRYNRQYDDRPNRQYEGNHHQNYDTRWQRDNYTSGERRPFRGGYRGNNRRYGHDGHSEGPSNWQANREDERGPSGSYTKNKVKLVDY